MVENRVYNEVQLPALRKNSVGSCDAGSRYLTVPVDFLSVYSLAMLDNTTGEYTYLMNKDVNMVREVYPNPTIQGLPKMYGQFNSTTLIIGPTPDKAYGVELHYFYYPASIVDSGGESWVSKNFPSVMLYGVIAEGYRFLKGEAQQQQIYDDQYAQALNLLRNLGESKQREDAYSTNMRRPSTTVGE
jgi:hypothetical protein